MKQQQTSTMFSMTGRRKSIFIKLALGINVCVLLYLGVQFWDNSHSNAPDLPNLSFLASDGKKRTLSSIDGASSNQTIMPSGLAEKVFEPIQCFEKDTTPRITMRGQYWVFYNYVSAEKKFKCNETVTYTTHCDHTFLDNLVPLLKRWQGPVSVALYTPGSDYEDAVKAVSYYRFCMDESQMVRDYVTFHFYFPYKHRQKGDILKWDAVLKNKVDCKTPPPTSSNTYRKIHSMTYPVNVGRNIARETANSHYIFPSDIELYPSPGLIPSILKMVTSREEEALKRPNPRVFVSSIFEIKEGHDLPETKAELVKLLKSKVVIPFHKMVCSQCHAIPKAQEWVTDPISDEMHVFHVGKRNPPYQHWEPIYIGTHQDPLYDERLSWEGRSDKMTQGYQLCVLDYDFMILNNAFLIHRPGIKTAKSSSSHIDKAKVAAQNDFIKKIIMPELKQLYGTRKGCEK